MAPAETVVVNDQTYSIPELSSNGFSVAPRGWRKPIDKKHFIIQTVGQVFDKNEFSFPHIPIVVDDIINKKFSNKNNIRILDCPIKFAGNNEFCIPYELRQFDEVLVKIISYEYTINPKINDYYAYLTIDQGNVVAGEYQRNPGCHIDGLQPARIKTKRPICRSYIAYDCVPPTFFAQSFKMDHLHEAEDDFFFALDDQVKADGALFVEPMQIVLTNAYSVHRSEKSDIDQYRTFFRLTFDLSKFDRYGNTHNPMFDYKWNMVSRDTRNHLKKRRLHHPDAY
jgi:hypothetical protein